MLRDSLFTKAFYSFLLCSGVELKNYLPDFLILLFFFHSGAKLNVRYSSRLNRPYEYYSTVYGTSKVIDWAE